MNRELPQLGEAAWRALEAHPWPGNVRELGNVMERLVIYHAGRDVEPSDLGLPQSLRASLFPYNAPQASPSEASPRSRPPAPSWGREQTGSGGFPSLPYALASTPSGGLPYAPDSGADLGRPPSGDFESLARSALEPAAVPAVPAGALSLDLPEGGTTFDDLEREILAQVLARADNNQSRAARSLGMSESTFRSRMKRLGLKA
jgi:DNA-binding NtrC family response regulator